MIIQVQETKVSVEVIDSDKRLSDEQFKELMAGVEAELRKNLEVNKSDLAQEIEE